MSGERAATATEPTDPAEPLAASVATEPTPRFAELEAALAAARLDAETQREQRLRALAETDNVRKRAQRDIDSAQRYALERFAGELLGVRDSLELAVRSGDSEGLQHGLEATLKLLTSAFEKYSIQSIDPGTGSVFDPALQEAVLSQPTGEAPPNTVLKVLQTGYQLNGRLLRPARVVVARAAD
ncbi:MAG TPA: nucleotide exchange factor GrpE [Steroidobacteraceae bacterium]